MQHSGQNVSIFQVIYQHAHNVETRVGGEQALPRSHVVETLISTDSITVIPCQNWFVVDVVECLSCGTDLASSATSFLLRVSGAGKREKSKREAACRRKWSDDGGSKQAATLHFMSASRISPHQRASFLTHQFSGSITFLLLPQLSIRPRTQPIVALYGCYDHVVSHGHGRPHAPF